MLNNFTTAYIVCFDTAKDISTGLSFIVMQDVNLDLNGKFLNS